MIKAVNHIQVSIPVGAEDRARRFYSDILGMREISKPESLAGRGGFWLEVNNFQIHFGTEDGIDRLKTKAHVAYTVDDLEHWRIELTKAGVAIINGIPIPNYERFEFRDPFGNRVEFLQKI